VVGTAPGMAEANVVYNIRLTRDSRYCGDARGSHGDHRRHSAVVVSLQARPSARLSEAAYGVTADDGSGVLAHSVMQIAAPT
jgi:hypothetical protein